MSPYWDHHVHLLATAAARCSLDVGSAPDIEAIRAAVGTAPGRGWLRAWGYDDAFLADGRHPTRDDLDAATTRPVVLHHRTGHVAVANTTALGELGATDHPDGVLVDRHDLLARVPLLPTAELEAAAAAVSTDWAGRGVAGFTDATHTNGLPALELLAGWVRRGVVVQSIGAMVGVDHAADVGPGARVGDVAVVGAKVMPRSDETDDLPAAVGRGHDAGLGVAVHAMDVDTLDRTVAAFEASPTPPGVVDRIEHCALCLPEQVERIAATGATVVVNPSFLLHRARKYRRELSAVEQRWLVRIRSLLDAGVPLLAGSDSPVVPSDPTEIIAAATAHPFTASESVDPAVARSLLQTR